MSGYQNWRTPGWLCDHLVSEFGCRVDVTSREFCAHGMKPWPHDGLTTAWPDRAFANPPFNAMGEWAAAALRNKKRWAMIAPASVSARWFHNLADQCMVFLPDVRIAYEDETGRARPDRDSVIFVWPGFYARTIATLGLRLVRDNYKKGET
ncbi:MAG: hypothetical protein E6Q97_37560 [Desulfurellales bacterium]|nr:MAG: hypothetical protein E6Q97_37560 [Desulfurellales bacterium]